MRLSIVDDGRRFRSSISNDLFIADKLQRVRAMPPRMRRSPAHLPMTIPRVESPFQEGKCVGKTPYVETGVIAFGTVIPVGFRGRSEPSAVRRHHWLVVRDSGATGLFAHEKPRRRSFVPVFLYDLQWWPSDSPDVVVAALIVADPVVNERHLTSAYKANE